jgi:subtilisin family serine protease
MDPALLELLRAAEEGADGDREIEAIIRLVRPDVDVPDVRIVARFGPIATCRLRASDVVAVRARDDVVSLKAARRLSPGFEPATAATAAPVGLRASDVRRDPLLTATGRGVVVAAVDWGVDVAAAAFRHPTTDSGGSTRFLSFWDQRDSAIGNRPARYGYGAVHDRDEIDHALRSPRPYQELGYHPAVADRGRGSHGTHVLDIAAGNGSGGGPLGLAPEADLVFVHLADRDTGGLANLGDSVRLLEAVDFIVRTAGSKPWVINLSVGRHGGPHDGTTLTELAFDALLKEAPGRQLVQSTGNYFRSRVHAGGTLAAGEVETLTFVSDPADVTPNELEIWYDGADEFVVRLDPPGGARSRPVGLGQQSDIVADGRVVGRIYHRARDPNNGDNHIDAFLYPVGSAGVWTVTLEARRCVSGRYDAWLERDDACPRCQARFTRPDSNGRTTTGTIANSHLPLIVGAYDNHDRSRPPAAFSSAGPTRDGRHKPDLAAPGVEVIAARSAPIGADQNLDLLVRKSGTSMATPHVTGSVAICLELAGHRLGARELRRLVLSSCEAPTSPDRGHRLGHGYLNTTGLVSAVDRIVTPHDSASRPQEPIVETNDITVLTAAPATALREFAYRPDGPTARWIRDRYDVIARPGQRVDRAARQGDLLLEITLGRPGGGRCVALDDRQLQAILARPSLRPNQLVLRPLAPLETSPGVAPEDEAEDTELDRLVDQGLSENHITNALFSSRHPGLTGVALQPGTTAAKEWRTIRDREVRPGLRQRLVIEKVDPVQLAVFLSQYENDSRVPTEYTKRFLTRTPLLSMGRSLRDRVLGHWRARRRPLTASGFYELALETAGNPGIAALLCHNVAKAFVRGGVAVTWRGTGTEGAYTDGQKTYTATMIHPAGRLKYYHSAKGREIVSIFYLLFSDREFGTKDPGDWYHFFVTATMTALSSEGTLGATTDRGRREDIDDQNGADLESEQALGWPRVTAFRFRNTGTTDPDNCCYNCPAGLGVGEGGGAWNRMELRFTLSGHRSGIEYEITRTRRDSLWQRLGGTWLLVGSSPMGTKDDLKGNYDECLVPHGGHIFSKDSPGFPNLVLPAPGRALNAEAFYGPGAVTSAAADDVVLRGSFAEWVIARSRAESIPWTPLELPPFRNGSRRRFIFWRCVVWIHRNGAGNFVLDAARSRIELGSFSAAVLNAEPV